MPPPVGDKTKEKQTKRQRQHRSSALRLAPRIIINIASPGVIIYTCAVQSAFPEPLVLRPQHDAITPLLTYTPFLYIYTNTNTTLHVHYS